MDTPSHGLFGVVIALILDLFFPQVGFVGMAVVIFGALAPDLTTAGPGQIVLARKLKKPVMSIDRDDWLQYQQLMPTMTKLYFFSHSFVCAGILILIGLAELYVFGSFWTGLLGIGWVSHLIYDLPTHTDEWSQKPFYPISSWVYPWGIINIWESHHKRWWFTSWGVHLAVIIGIIAFR